jgi:alpha-L-rhamnosidase
LSYHVAVSNLRIGRTGRGEFVDEAGPRLSWRIECDRADWRQASVEVTLETAGRVVTTAIETADSIAVPWPFEPLSSFQAFTIRVRAHGDDGVLTDWSEPESGLAGLVGDRPWSAPAISLPHPEHDAQPILARREFHIDQPIRRAFLSFTALGVADWEINGNAVGRDVLSPGWTPYPRRLVHVTHDVTALLRPGGNAIGARIAGAWYTEGFGWGEQMFSYGEQPAASAELTVELEDGTSFVLPTDGHWSVAATGETVTTGLFAGETADLRREPAGWSHPDFDDREWISPRVDPLPIAPGATSLSPTRRTAELPVVRLDDPAPGRILLDVGQNIAGRLRIRVNGPAGTRIRLRHAEVLDGGQLFTVSLRGAASVDEIVLDGGETVWEPRFTFHGFRYAEIEGWPGPFRTEDVTAVVLHADMERIGWFECSSALVNRLHENVVWGMRGNFLAVPTDCPQRDERFGWTGDIGVFVPTATFLYDCEGFLGSWLRDLALEQAVGGAGAVPNLVPNVLYPPSTTGAAVWGDAGTIVPANLYETFGDPRLIADQLDSMRDWVAHVASRAGADRVWRHDFQFGDWMAPGDDDRGAEPSLIATAYFARSAEILAEALRIAGQDDTDAEKLVHEIRVGWHNAFVRPDGSLEADTATAYAIAIVFGLVRDPELEASFGRRLRELVETAGHVVTTGFVGTPIVVDALTRTGHADTAALLLLQTETPSWLATVLAGGTTMWERWDGIQADGSPHPNNSFNHYAFGGVAAWLHQTVAGLSAAAPGYREIRIAPVPLPGLTHARARHETPYGTAEVSWRELPGGKIEVAATVPALTVGHFQLPGHPEETVPSGRHVRVVDDVRPGRLTAAADR